MICCAAASLSQPKLERIGQLAIARLRLHTGKRLRECSVEQRDLVDGHYYRVARPNTIAEKLVVHARNGIYDDFCAKARPTAHSTILDVGVSDVLTDAANVLERRYPHLDHVTAVGLGTATEFRQAYPQVEYRQIEPHAALPFHDRQFDIATSNAVLEHVGSHQAQSRFVAELARVSRFVYLTVPNRFFPVEHHTAIPLLHWTDTTFRLACRLLRKTLWTDPETLIFLTKSRLHAIASGLGPAYRVGIGQVGIHLGPFSSNLFMTIEATPE